LASAWHIFPMQHFRANFFSNMRALSQARLAGTLLKAFRVCGDNFLPKRGGWCFWCWVGSWREPVEQRFDGML